MGYSTLPKKRWPLWNVPAPTSAKLGPGELCPTTCAARPITTQADLSWPLEAARAALALEPQDERLQGNVKLLECLC